VDIHEDVTVTLPYWKWVYFVGWLNAQQPDKDDQTLNDVRGRIESGVIP